MNEIIERLPEFVHLTTQEILDYLDSTLSEEERTGVERHLRLCRRCSDRVSHVKNALKQAETAKDKPFPQELIPKALEAFYKGLKNI